MTDPMCDPETGACIVPDTPIQERSELKPEIFYVGDPMCSWCWGMSKEVSALAKYCADQGFGFRIVMGGLRAGGGDPWNASFKKFLRDEWQHIGAATGQPFSFKVLDRPFFNYDTEPACRAVATARALYNDERQALAFFAAVQHKFYVDGEDPKEVEFYRDICNQNDLDFEQFAAAFASPDARQEVMAHFRLTRELGCRGFPSIIARSEGKTYQIASGYRRLEDLKPIIANLPGASK